jgi:hypothetical protein
MSVIHRRCRMAVRVRSIPRLASLNLAPTSNSRVLILTASRMRTYPAMVSQDMTTRDESSLSESGQPRENMVQLHVPSFNFGIDRARPLQPDGMGTNVKSPFNLIVGRAGSCRIARASRLVHLRASHSRVSRVAMTPAISISPCLCKPKRTVAPMRRQPSSAREHHIPTRWRQRDYRGGG